jgi:hypothetical protein
MDWLNDSVKVAVARIRAPDSVESGHPVFHKVDLCEV